jgi:hypothetical protein
LPGPSFLLLTGNYYLGVPLLKKYISYYRLKPFTEIILHLGLIIPDDHKDLNMWSDIDSLVPWLN